MSLSADDFMIYAKTVMAEAGGEPWLGRLAVAWVIRNRVDADLGNDNKPDWWGEGYRDVCLKPNQFSCWRADFPGRDRITVSDFENSASLRDCAIVCLHTLGATFKDPTRGSTHYVNLRMAKPAWATERTPAVVIGQHTFYNNVK